MLIFVKLKEDFAIFVKWEKRTLPEKLSNLIVYMMQFFF